LHGDYYLPELKLPPEDDIQYGKYGLIRLSYLKEEKESYYAKLLIHGQLIAHLNEVDREANHRMEKLVNEMARHDEQYT